jgi:hypothetical protein
LAILVACATASSEVGEEVSALMDVSGYQIKKIRTFATVYCKYIPCFQQSLELSL